MRHVLLGLVLSGTLTTAAQAQDVVPLPGTGENIAGVARVEFPGANEVELAGDWAFVSVEKGLGGEADGGLVIVNVADPEQPFIEGTWFGKEDSKISDVRPASYRA